LRLSVLSSVFSSRVHVFSPSGVKDDNNNQSMMPLSTFVPLLNTHDYGPSPPLPGRGDPGVQESGPSAIHFGVIRLLAHLLAISRPSSPIVARPSPMAAHPSPQDPVDDDTGKALSHSPPADPRGRFDGVKRQPVTARRKRITTTINTLMSEGRK